jgi:alkylation response protein AidB-like acyl-CoA dehydrogenase
VALAEELGASLATGLAMSVLAHAGMVIPLLDPLARTDGIRGWLSDAREGRALLGLGVTEASSGGDMNAIETVATFENDGILLRGAKRYVTNGSTADALVVLARIEEGSAPWSTALVLVPTATPGVTRSRLAMAGLRSGDTGAIELRDCRVPSDHLLGEPGRGFLYVMAGLQRERLLGALGVNALARSVLERTVAFCRGRVRMGEPLIAKQAIRHRLAELEAKLEAGRHFAWAVAERFARGEAVDREVWMLKVFCYEAAQELVTACAHLHGAEALLEDHWMSRALHDAEAFTLAAGSAEIMREMLAAGYDSGGPAPATGGRRSE